MSSISMRKRKSKMFFLVILILVIFLIWQDNSLMVTRYQYRSPHLPESFSGLKIVQISDLHNKRFGSQQQRIVKAIKNENPDLIVITGDIVDCHRFNLQPVKELIAQIAPIAPIYYVPGNHEAKSGRYMEVNEALNRLGVIVLSNEAVSFNYWNDSIRIIGLEDPTFIPEDYYRGTTTWKIEECLNEYATTNQFNLLLTHHPELMSVYAKYPVDLIFAGHAHGGQIRIPYVQGIFSPNQGLFPKYDSGMYLENNSTLIVSRGLGNSVFPFRVFNRPEIVVVTLDS